jgi:hypothetical protein
MQLIHFSHCQLRRNVFRKLHILRLQQPYGRRLRGHHLPVQQQHLPDQARLQLVHNLGAVNVVGLVHKDFGRGSLCHQRKGRYYEERILNI